VQSQAGDEEPHSGVDEEWQTQNPRLLLGMQYQDVQVGESVNGASYGLAFRSGLGGFGQQLSSKRKSYISASVIEFLMGLLKFIA
jgi:hypothetical protein